MISKRMKELINGTSVIRAMFEEGKKLAETYGKENVFDFSLGNPNVPAPEELKKSLLQILQKKDPIQLHGYMDNRGHEEVRKKIANHLNNSFHKNYDEEEILMTVGAAGGLNVIFSSLLNPGDEVITFSPYFSEYKHYVENFGGNLIALSPNTEHQFRPSVEELRKKITPQTKALLLNNPNNPTGIVYSEEEIKNIALLLETKSKEYLHPIYIISDEPYRELVYDGLILPYIPDFYRNTILCYSYSKSLALAGERIGYLLIPKTVVDAKQLQAAAKISTRILGFVNAPSLIQLAVADCQGLTSDFTVYDKNRLLLYHSLTQMGFEVIKPEGAFYLFLKSPEDDFKFVETAKEYNLLFVPASAFGAPGYVRIAYCVKTEVIKKSLPAFFELAKRYHLS